MNIGGISIKQDFSVKRNKLFQNQKIILQILSSVLFVK